MSADIDIDRISIAAIDGATMAQTLADKVEAMAMHGGQPRSGLLDLAASAQGAAAQASMAAAAACDAARAAWCIDPQDEPTIPTSDLDRAVRLLGTVQRALDAVIKLYGRACLGITEAAAV